MFYVYMLTDPRTNMPFYIGKGKGNRAYIHGKEMNICNQIKEDIINDIIADGLEHMTFIVETDLTENDAFELEKLLITTYGRQYLDKNGILANRTLGGEGCSGRICSDETKQKISKANTGKTRRSGYKLTDDHKQKISKGNAGKSRNNAHLHTAEIKEKRAQTFRGKTFNDDWRKNISNSLTGRSYEDLMGSFEKAEAKKNKISTALKGRTLSDEIKKKYSESKLGSKNPSYGKSWYTDGNISKLFVSGSEPPGFNLGRKIK